MSSSVIVYSPDDIRGRIVSKTLKASGIKTFLFSSHFEVKEAISGHSPAVIILDLKKKVSGELNFLETLSYKFSEATIIALSDTSNAHVLENLGLTNLLCVSDPLDPELILSMVKDTLAGEFSIRSCLRILQKALSKFSRLVIRSLKIIVLLIIGLFGGYLYWCFSTLPPTENLDEYSPYESSKIFSYDNVLLTEFYVERRTFIPHEMIPKDVINAFIAVEDMRYYKHHGIDIIRTLGALFRNIKEGAFVQGGSTITQQLAKMLFLKPEKTITRKIKEIVLSIQIEKEYTKDEILGFYLNQAYFGARAYGIEAASQAYFGKSTEKIGISEAALLAALPKAPSKYSPFKNHDESLNRRNHVLRRMLVAGFINEKEYNVALSDPIPVKYHGRKHKAPYFVDYCKTVLEKKYGDRLYTSGLKIYTTLDYKEQLKAERAVRKGIEKLKKRGIEEIQAAFLAVELKTGRIKAMVGGTNFWDSQFNRVTQAMRQPGSAFKPIVYLTALKKGFRLDDVLEDQEVTYVVKGRHKKWTPRNHREIYHGTVTLKKALALSLNAATVSLAKKIKIKSVIETAETLGIRSKVHPFYPSALGASELSLMELVYAFAAFARGNRIEPMCIDRIIDREKLALVEPSGVREKVIDNKVLANLKRMLRDVILNGTGIKARSLDRKVYGKTGTTNDYADAWFIGFDDKIVAGVWVGRDNRMPIGENETGSRAALPIWIEYMKN